MIPRLTSMTLLVLTFALFSFCSTSRAESPYKATSNASSFDQSNYQPKHASDGDRSTRWCSSRPYGKQEWLQLDLGEVKPIGHVEILWEVAYARGYQLSTSNDAEEWHTVFKTKEGNGGRDVLSNLQASGRYLRLDFLERGTAEHGFSIWEVSVSAEASVALAKPLQSLEELEVTEERFATVEVLTDQGTFDYHLDNSGDRDVSAALQEIFNRTAALDDVSAEFIFHPGVYFIDAPITVKMVCLTLKGTAHGGLDIFGLNLKSGTIFRFGENTGPNCITFLRASHSKSFPSGESPWDYYDSKVEVKGMTFVGYNNTGVDTANGYSRMRGDQPNFRGLNWYPAKGRYQDVEKEGQRALFFPKGPGKNEMLRVNSCVFTDLYVGIETEYCDVCYITDSWFAQMVYGIRMEGHNPICMIKNNCFADLETGITLGAVVSSGLNDNGFAYVSKCFVIKDAQQTTINNNTLLNWKLSTGAAAHGGFCHVGSSKNLVMMGNTLKQEIDSRTKTRTVDEEPNGRAFINIENSRNLIFSNNAVDTIQTQTVVKLKNVANSVITDNIITFAKGGNAVAQTGSCRGNFYRPLDPKNSAPFDSLKE